MLHEIVARCREQYTGSNFEDEYRRVEHQLPLCRNFKQALISESKISIIAEIKRRSPSKGHLADIQVSEFVQSYEKAGTSAISVLTNKQYFDGSIADLREAKKNTSVPILRKEFIVSSSQLYESRIIGADAVLLIAAALTPKELHEFSAVSRSIGLEVLAEVHNREELNLVLDAGSEIIGVNNRDLTTFNVSLSNAEELAPLIPEDKVTVCESGIKTRQDMLRMQACGFNAALIGETIVTSENPHLTITSLLGQSHD